MLDHGVGAADEDERVLVGGRHVLLHHFEVDATLALQPLGRRLAEDIVRAEAVHAEAMGESLELVAQEDICLGLVGIDEPNARFAV